MNTMEFDVYKNEKHVISQAEKLLNSNDSRISADEYQSLLERYQKLFKTTRRLIRISDKFEEQLKEANTRIQLQQRELEHQNEILNENIKLRENVERITRHDLKNPLNSIINYPKLISKENLTETEGELLDKISASGYKLLKMINLTLDLYKMEQGTYQLIPDRVNILKILNDIFQEFRFTIVAQYIDFDIQINGSNLLENDQFHVLGEELLIYSMLANLVKNAIEASPKKATIRIDMKTTPSPTISIENPGRVPEDIRESFFDKYATSGKKEGTGLGTYSAKLIMDTHGGMITMDTSEKKGTTICVTFLDQES